eukprot:1154215-Pelagomonas_calceolata.AAC.3
MSSRKVLTPSPSWGGCALNWPGWRKSSEGRMVTTRRSGLCKVTARNQACAKRQQGDQAFAIRQQGDQACAK